MHGTPATFHLSKRTQSCCEPYASPNKVWAQLGGRLELACSYQPLVILSSYESLDRVEKLAVSTEF